MKLIPIKNKYGTSYKIRVKLPNGKTSCKTFRNQRQAEKAKVEMLSIRNTTGGDVLTLGKTKVDDFFYKVFVPYKVSLLGKSAQKSYCSHYKNHLRQIIGHKRLSTINPLDGDSIQKKLQSMGHNEKGTNLIMRTAKTMLNYAVERGYLIKNPFNPVRQLKEPSKIGNYWEADEVKIFLDVVKDHYSYPFFVTALNTGMRRGELASLKWKSVDFTRKRIKVVSSRDRYGDKNLTKGRTDRTIPMNPRLVELLQSMKPLNAGSDDYVFLGPDGVPIDPQHVYRLMGQLREKANISKIRFHDLRHTFASHFMMNQGNITQLALILGHTDQRVTNRYIHFAPDYLDSAAGIVSF